MRSNSTLEQPPGAGGPCFSGYTPVDSGATSRLYSESLEEFLEAISRGTILKAEDSQLNKVISFARASNLDPWSASEKEVAASAA